MPRLSMFWQLYAVFGLLIVLSLGALGAVVGAWVEQEALLQVEEHLKSKALLLQEIARDHQPAELQRRIDTLRQKTETRITLIAANGRVLVESDRDPADLDDHGKRPEVEAARNAPFGTATRYSTSVRQNMMYVAIKMPEPSEIAFVRVARPVTEVQAHASHLRNLVWGAAGGTALAALLLAWLLTRRLVRPLQALTARAGQIAAGEFGHKVYLDRKDELGQLADAFNQMSVRLAQQFNQLDEDRQQLRAVLGSMVEGVIAIDAEQNILFANDRAGQMLAFASKTAAGRRLWEVVRQHAVQEIVQTTMRTGSGAASGKLEFTDPAGKSLLLHVAQLPGETARGAVLVFHDTTELRRLERLRQDFVANVSHELKTPLSVIKACIETLLEGGVNDVENRGRFLDRIQEQTQRLHALILDLLSLARIESGEQVWTLESLGVAEAAAACVERHRARATGKKQTLTLETPASVQDTKVFADVEALSEILDNLVDNALKYTPEGGTIRLRWWNDDGHCNIEVQDTGIGIPAADLPRIFERFYRVDKARARELGGTGLGLSIVKHLVQAMKGAIRADSALGKGSTFTIRLPRSAS